MGTLPIFRGATRLYGVIHSFNPSFLLNFAKIPAGDRLLREELPGERPGLLEEAEEALALHGVAALRVDLARF